PSGSEVEAVGRHVVLPLGGTEDLFCFEVLEIQELLDPTALRPGPHAEEKGIAREANGIRVIAILGVGIAGSQGKDREEEKRDNKHATKRLLDRKKSFHPHTWPPHKGLRNCDYNDVDRLYRSLLLTQYTVAVQPGGLSTSVVQPIERSQFENAVHLRQACVRVALLHIPPRSRAERCCEERSPAVGRKHKAPYRGSGFAEVPDERDPAHPPAQRDVYEGELAGARRDLLERIRP